MLVVVEGLALCLAREGQPATLHSLDIVEWLTP
jgi:hypothetical protein